MRSEHCIDTIQPPRGPLGVAALAWFLLRRIGHALASGFDWLLVCSERSAERRQLAELDDHMLRDIGLSRADVMAETTKSFWQP